MNFRNAVTVDLDAIMTLLEDGRRFLHANHVPQWINGYPSQEVIMQDIHHGNAYLMEESHKVIAFATVIYTGEKTYDKIYDGAWLSLGQYGVVHRMAVASEYRGKNIASAFLKEIENLTLSKSISSIKIDTHEKNIVMQKLLLKNGYQYCGVIYLEDGDKRLAFELRVEN